MASTTNSTTPTVTTNSGINQFVDVGYASIGFILLCSALVFLMTPGVGLFYSGMVRSKHALSLIMVSLLAMAVVSVQWFLFGFSLAFSESGSFFVGNFNYAGLANVGSNALTLTAPQIPGIAYALYQLQFAAITPSIIFGSIAERIRLVPSLIFIFIWSTLVYDFAAYWTWSARGWLHNLACIDTTGLSSIPCGLGAIDYAGGGPVHITSGFAGLAFCLFLGKRERVHSNNPHNMTQVFLGTILIWFGWFAFNGGSAIAATPRAAMAAMVTTICASFGGLTWVLLDFAFSRKLSGVGFCSGAITGLVVITPASGFVAPWAAAVMGIFGGVFVNLSLRGKERLGYDDALDAFGIHGVGGFLGSILTGIFHQAWVPALDGTITKGGLIEGNWTGLGYQFAAAISIASYTMIMTSLILFVLSKIPGFSFHYTEEEAAIGGDLCEMGEMAYSYIKKDRISNASVYPEAHKSSSSSVEDVIESVPMKN